MTRFSSSAAFYLHVFNLDPCIAIFTLYSNTHCTPLCNRIIFQNSFAHPGSYRILTPCGEERVTIAVALKHLELPAFATCHYGTN